MLSYKQYKALNESFNCTLGLVQPKSIGIASEAGPTLAEFMALLDEKKKMKKKMLGEKPNMDMGDDDETGDGEMVEPSAIKDKKAVKDDDMGDDDDDAEDDMDDDDGDDMDDDASDDSGDSDDGMDMSKLKGLTGDKLMMMKKKMKAKMKKKMGSEKKKMKKEDVDASPEDNSWIQSVNDMMKGSNERNWDGMFPHNEDALIPLSDPNQGLAAQSEPGPGEVGFAPQGKVVDFFGSGF